MSYRDDKRQRGGLMTVTGKDCISSDMVGEVVGMTIYVSCLIGSACLH